MKEQQYNRAYKPTVYIEKQKKIRSKGNDTGFSGSVGMVVLWGFPQVFLWVWGENSIPTAALYMLYMSCPTGIMGLSDDVDDW